MAHVVINIHVAVHSIILSPDCSGMTDPVCMAPSVRLLRVCEERQHGTLDNIDALLGSYSGIVFLTLLNRPYSYHQHNSY